MEWGFGPIFYAYLFLKAIAAGESIFIPCALYFLLYYKK